MTRNAVNTNTANLKKFSKDDKNATWIIQGFENSTEWKKNTNNAYTIYTKVELINKSNKY